MEHTTSAKNRQGINALKMYWDKQRNTSRWLISLLICIALIQLTQELNRSKCGYPVYGTERTINHLLYMSDLKLTERSEEELGN